MSNIKKVKSSLDSFLVDKTPVLVLKGAWGVGKTYFWNEYIKENISNKRANQIAYSYVSLFGLNSLEQLKTKIFENGKPIKSKEEVEKEFQQSAENMSSLYQYVPWLKDFWQTIKFKSPWLGRLTKHGKELPWINKVAPLISAVEYGLVKNYLICFDDLERKGDKLSVKEIMGLVDELSTRKECQVVLIFNEKTLAEDKADKEDFDKYREKVVDIELEYKPSVKENLLLIFSGEEIYFERLLSAFQLFGISNIRIFKKTKWVLDKIEPYIKSVSKSLQNEIANHIAVFCWSFYKAENSLPLSVIRNSIKTFSWMSALANEKAQLSDEDKRWKELASSLGLAPADYDDSLISLIESGFFEESEFSSTVNKINSQIAIAEAREQLHRAWEIYANSFNDNIEEFKSALREVLERHIEKIGIWDFSTTIDVLKEFGNNVDGYVDKYIEKHRQSFSKIDEDIFGKRKIKNEKLQNAISEEKNKISKDKNIDDILYDVAKKQSWSFGDIEYLVSLSVEDIYKWMMSSPLDLKAKIKDGLLFFRKISTNNEAEASMYKTIVNNTVEALKKVSTLNRFNAERVKNIYGIDIQGDGN